MSVARPNILINTIPFVKCVDGESTIDFEVLFDEKPLLGKWKINLSQTKVGDLVEGGDKTIEFNDGTYISKSIGFEDEGTYNFEKLKGVSLTSLSKNIRASIFVEEETAFLELSYDCIEEKEVCFERYTRIDEM